MEDKHLNKIINLFSFNINLTKLESQSPDYILEKYNHWIGTDPIIPVNLYTPDDLLSFMLRYQKRWGSTKLVRRQLMYLKLTENLNIRTMVSRFEEYIGPIEMISSERNIYRCNGLHEITKRDFIPKVLEKNNGDIITILRDLKINSLI